VTFRSSIRTAGLNTGKKKNEEHGCEGENDLRFSYMYDTT